MRFAKPDMNKILGLWKSGNDPGTKTGFTDLDKYWTVKRGHTTLVTGYPTSGKTQFTLQILCNLTSLYQWRHVVYSPETGNCEDIYAEIIHCLTGKTFNKLFNNYISEKEIYEVMPYVTDYFKVIEPTEEGIGLEHWFSSVTELCKEFTIHTATIDNWNDLEHNMANAGHKISEYLKFQLPKFNRFCKNERIHGFLLAHPKNPQMMGKGEISAPTPFDIEGGSLWYAKGQSILVIHRDWSDPNDFTTHITIAKVKPKIVGKKGFTELQFAPAFNCYFEANEIANVYPESQFKISGRPKEKDYEQRISEEIQNTPF